MSPDEHDLHTLAGAYVLDAISEDERIRFGAHLADCPECREEIRELREATARLGVATAVHPRSELRAQTIQAASRISQTAPVIAGRGVREAGRQAPGRPGPQRRPSVLRRLAFRGTAGPAAWPRLALAAAVITIGGVLGLVTVMHNPAPGHSRQDHMISDVLKASDAVMLTARISAGGMATAVISHRQHMGVFMARDLPALPPAESYEVWVMGPRGDRPAGMLRLRRGGMAGPAVLTRMAPGDMIGLTIEPASGSRHPTSATLVLIGPKSGS